MAGAALALHLPAAAPTDHLAFQNVVCRLPLRNYIVCSGLKCLLNGIECSGSDQRFMGGFYSSFLFSLYQHTCIGTIGKNVFDRSAVPTAVAIAKVSIQTVGSSVLDWSWEPSFIQISDNAGHASAACRHLKDFPNNDSSYRIRNKLTWILVRFLITKWSSWPDKISVLRFHI